MKSATQATVAAELVKATERAGPPRLIVSDPGSDLNGGVKEYQQKNPGTAHVHDLAHQAANMLKQRWNKDEQWSTFVQRLAQAGAKVRPTEEAHLRPPTVRPKTRFKNVGPTLRFAGRVLRLRDSGAPSKRVEANFG